MATTSWHIKLEVVIYFKQFLKLTTTCDDQVGMYADVGRGQIHSRIIMENVQFAYFS